MKIEPGTSGTSVTPKRAMKRRRTSELQQAISELGKVQVALQNTGDLSEADSFGQYVSSCLKKLCPRNSIRAQSEMQQILYKYRLDEEEETVLNENIEYVVIQD